VRNGTSTDCVDNALRRAFIGKFEGEINQMNSILEVLKWDKRASLCRNISPSEKKESLCREQSGGRGGGRLSRVLARSLASWSSRRRRPAFPFPPSFAVHQIPERMVSLFRISDVIPFFVKSLKGKVLRMAVAMILFRGQIEMWTSIFLFYLWQQAIWGI